MPAADGSGTAEASMAWGISMPYAVGAVGRRRSRADGSRFVSVAGEGTPRPARLSGLLRGRVRRLWQR